MSLPLSALPYARHVLDPHSSHRTIATGHDHDTAYVEKASVPVKRTNADDAACIARAAVAGRDSYKPIRRILCATDLSARCVRAVRRAEILANQANALLLLLHVEGERLSPELIGRRRGERARRILEARHPKSSAEIIVRRGTPHRTIARVANRWDADLVVLGAHRRRSAARFTGTTSEAVIRTARRAVLVVNGEPMGAYRDILLSGDRPESLARAVSQIQRLGLLDGVRSSIVQVLKNPSRSVFYSAWMMEHQIDRYMQFLRQSSREDLLAQLDAAGLDPGRFTLIQKHGSPVNAIERVIEAVRPQLLVLGASRRRQLKRMFRTSIANQLAGRVECDVLITSAADPRHSMFFGRRCPDAAVRPR